MTVVSSKEFIADEDKYFDLALNGGVCIRRGDFVFQLVSRPVEKQYLPKPVTAYTGSPLNALLACFVSFPIINSRTIVFWRSRATKNGTCKIGHYFLLDEKGIEEVLEMAL